MKIHKIILSALVIAVSIIACESLPKEEGIAKIYFTGGSNGVAEISPADVSIDKENKTMTFAFGISRSGLQPAIGFTVNCEVDNTLVPANTVPLSEDEYTLSTKDGEMQSTIKFGNDERSKTLYLTVAEEVFARYNGKKLAVHLRMSAPSHYELNASLSEMDIVIDVLNFLGAYEDITESVLKNFKSPFEVTLDSPPLGSCDPEQHTPTEWTVNDAVKIHKYNGKMHGGVDARCWGNRNWLSAGNFDFFNDREVINGKIYQTAKLEAGQYSIEYEIAEAFGGPNHAALVVAAAETLPDFDKKEEESIASQEFTTGTSMSFGLEQDETTVSIGFVYYIPKGVQGSYAISSIRVKRQINVFNQ